MSITIEEWNSNPKLSSELREALAKPIVVQAFELVKELRMADRLDGQDLLKAYNIETLFGYDVGRGSVFKDLIALSTETKPTKPLKPSYKDATTTDDASKS